MMSMPIHDDLRSPDTTLREEAFSFVLGSNSDQADKLLAEIIHGDDDGLKIQFCNFIDTAPRTKRSFAVLAAFLEDSNTYLRDKAAKAFEKSDSFQKKTLIIKMLQSENDTVVDFAIKEAGNFRLTAAIPYLIHLCKTADKERLLKILAILHHIRATESIDTFLRMLDKDDEDILFTALQALGSFSKYIRWKKGIPFVIHYSPTVRKAAVWFLNHYQSRQIKELYLTCYFNETDFAVRNEILQGLTKYNDFKIIRTLVDTATKSDDSTARLLASSALDTLPMHMQHRMFRYYRSNKNPRIRAFVVSKLNIVNNRTMKLVTDMLRKDTDPYVRAASAESLAHNKSDAAIQILEQSFFYDDSKIVKFSALMALTRLWEFEHWPKIYAILEYSEEHFAQEQIIVLRFLQKKLLREAWKMPEDLTARILYRLTSANMNIRYLCVQIVKTIKTEKAMIPLIDLYISSNNQYEREEILNALEAITYSDPLFLFSYIVLSRRNQKLFVHLIDIISQLKHDPSLDYEILLQFSTLFLRETSKSMKHKIVTSMLTIFKKAYCNLGSMIHAEAEEWIEILLECIKYARREDMKVLGPDLFLYNLDHEDPVIQKIAVSMMGLFEEERSIAKLSELAIKHKNEKIRVQARKSLYSIMSKETIS